jgi:mycothiol synthase
MANGLKLDLPAGFAARVPTRGDLEDVVAVVAASEEATHGVVDITVEDIRSDWERPSFDLSTDAVVVTDDERIVAYAEVFVGRAWVHVHPNVHGRGVGAALLRWTESRAREMGSEKIGQTVPDTNRSAAELLSTNGYGVRWNTWMFQKELDAEPAEPRLPDGMTLRTFAEGRDARAAFELIDTAFSDWPDRDPSFGFDDWVASFLRRGDFDPSLAFLMEDGGELVGVALCLVYGDEGWVQQIAVKRSHRGRGLGGALLQAAFREFYKRGFKTAGLSTESRTGARGVYEHVGMKVTRSFTRYSRDLEHPRPWATSGSTADSGRR